MTALDAVRTVAVFAFSFVLTVLIHECGHVMFAKLVGFGVAKVSLGSNRHGPVIFRRGIFGTTVEILVPMWPARDSVLGSVWVFATSHRHVRVKQAIVICGGSLANLAAVLVAVLLLVKRVGWGQTAPEPVLLWGLLNAVGALAIVGPMGDGKIIRQILKLSSSTAVRLDARLNTEKAFLEKCLLPWREGRADEFRRAVAIAEPYLRDSSHGQLAWRYLRANLDILDGQLEKAAEALRKVRRLSNPEARSAAQADIAAIDLFSCREELLSEAGRRARAAFALEPWSSVARLVHAAVVIREGNTIEGAQLLDKVGPLPLRASERGALLLCIRAQANHAIGRVTDAKSDWEAACAQDPHERVVRRAYPSLPSSS
jgi:Peptidase family M50